MNHRYIPLLLAVLSLLPTGLLPTVAGAAHADRSPVMQSWQVASSDDWTSLSEQEQKVLKQHRRNWDSYSPEQKARLRAGAKRYQNLSPEERQEVEREKQRYETMSPQERRDLREKYNRSRDR